MKIILLRHGRPNISFNVSGSSEDFARWVDEYNVSCLDSRLRPKQALVSVANSCTNVICSTLSRSTESAKMLGVDCYQCFEDFIEAELPLFKIPFFKLKASVWLILFRALWLFGINGRAESYRRTKLRARSCAEKLQRIAINNDSVLFVGHGILNKLIATELLKLGWKGDRNSEREYWGYSHYEK